MFENPYDRRPIGVIDLKVTRVFAFVVISLSVVLTAVMCVLAVWEVLVPAVAWRSLGSLGIVAAATAVFVALNEGFGPGIHEVSPSDAARARVAAREAEKAEEEEAEKEEAGG
ncbi:MAG: hypothetical protein AAF078_11075 [Planctomycetota bacterium]